MLDISVKYLKAPLSHIDMTSLAIKYNFENINRFIFKDISNIDRWLKAANIYKNASAYADIQKNKRKFRTKENAVNVCVCKCCE
jgi:hypothetical protein